MKLRLAHKIILIASLPLVFAVSFVLIFRTVLKRAEAVSQRERVATATTSECFNAIAPFVYEGMQFAERKFNNDPASIARVRKSRAWSARSLADAKQLCQGKPDEIRIVDELAHSCAQCVQASDQIMQVLGAHNAFDSFSTAELYRKGLLAMNHLNELNQEMNAHVQDDLKKNPADSTAMQQTIKILILAGQAAVMALSLAMAVLLSRQITARLDVIAQNSKRLSNSEPLLPPLVGSDEIADLDRIFHQTAAALVEATGKEKAAIAHALDVICSLDRQNRFVAVSPASTSAWGFEPAELLGLNFLRILAAEDLAPTQLELSTIMKGSAGKTFENRVVHKDGTLKDMVWSVRWSAQEDSLFCIAHDITERKLAERMLRSNETQIRLMMERMPAGLVVTDENGSVTLINARTEQMFGYSSAELVGKPLSKLFGEEANDNAAYMQSLKQQAMGKVVPMAALKRGGEKRFLELSLDSFGSVENAEYLLILLDMTETYEVQRLKQRLIAMIAHDIAAPLSSISATLKLLSNGVLGPLSPSDERRVRLTEQESQRLIRLFQDLLRIEKYDAHEIALTMAAASLRAITDRSIALVQAQAEQKGISIIDCCNKEIEFKADEDRLTQVLVNLLSNAVKFSPDGSTITVSLKESEDSFELLVSDQGRGIPPGSEATIFEPLKQVSPSDETEKGGFGLGLAICKSIVLGHGGTIGVINRDSGGSTFWIKLPLVPPGALK